MIGVTIGVGAYAMLARQAAAAFSEKTGLQVYILGDDEFASSGLSMPHYLKFRIFDLVPDDEDIVFFDSDMVCLNAGSRRRTGIHVLLSPYATGSCRLFRLMPRLGPSRSKNTSTQVSSS